MSLQAIVVAVLGALGAGVIGWLWVALQKAKKGKATAEAQGRSAVTEEKVKHIQEECDEQLKELAGMDGGELLDAARKWAKRVLRASGRRKASSGM